MLLYYPPLADDHSYLRYLDPWLMWYPTLVDLGLHLHLHCWTNRRQFDPHIDSSNGCLLRDHRMSARQ
ncbi:Uncharacterised protein [Vibrio cholerae]|nr:Uncharacterised protein [Vibrio cholerae]CSI48211.1 Uncharacterised protein [Vibrio cholerae]CSI74102.1 Uncharacterised protein [Vibrio cholerae]